jgi:hypothetical protein
MLGTRLSVRESSDSQIAEDQLACDAPSKSEFVEMPDEKSQSWSFSSANGQA